MGISKKLIKRVLSAAIIAPPFVYTIIVGDVLLALWLLLAFAVSIYEWYGLARKIDHFFIPNMVWGVVYMGISYSSFLALREVYSIQVLLLFLGMIWFSDIGAYFVGKTYGGPKLIKHISPNKTWSGFAGAIVFPAAFSVIWTGAVGLNGLFSNTEILILYSVIGLVGAAMGSIGQAGDLLISFIKRQAGVKDTGSIIPGHGGLLDRIDSMLLGAPVFLVLITLLSYVL